MNVLFHYDAGPWLEQELLALSAHDITAQACAVKDWDRFYRLIARAEALWHVLEPVTAKMLERAPGLRLIQKIGVGVNTIDLEAARGRGIAVCNMPGTNTRAVAEMTLCLMIAALRRLTEHDAALRRGQGWALPPATQDALGELGGRTVGLLGYGAVPSVLAPILTALGADVIYHCRMPKPHAIGRHVEFAELIATSDILSLHIPQTEQTRGIISASVVAAMKPGAVLINTARGGLVDEAALSTALAGGQLAAAGLDVFAEEPVAADNPLLKLPNIVLYPHKAWLTRETLSRSLTVAVENCRRLRTGAEFLHRVV
jgi:phosphoglycerate dehydrogenase-like enzyme